MTTAPRPDFADRSPAGLAAQFRHFGRVEAPQLDSPLYAELCEVVADDPELLALAAHTSPSQPPPNMLFAAVQYLLWSGSQHELRSFYPMLATGSVAADPPGPAFRDFCLAERVRIEPLLATRRTQTNVLRRCACLLPAFARIARGPLALVEIGTSAGLNLHWDRYHYDYSNGSVAQSWGDPKSPVSLPCELRGAAALPELPPSIPIAWRRGIDINPIDLADDDAVRWLRALIWPEHVDRHARLDTAIQVAREHPVPVVEGNAALVLEAVLDAVPGDAAVCVFGTHTLYQFSREDRRAVYSILQRGAETRDVDFLSMEGTGAEHSELIWTRYRGRTRESIQLANANPHGWWIEWLQESP